MNKQVIAVALISVTIFSCNPNQNQNSDSDSSAIKSIDKKSDSSKKLSKEADITSESPNWKYEVDSSDKMEKNKVYFATCETIDQINLDFPYDRGSTLKIVVRRG
jgi:hypothetical protein